jgi:hypothetical protein
MTDTVTSEDLLNIKTTCTVECGELKISMTTDGHTLTQAVQMFQDVLRGCGYYFEGNLDFVDEE